MQTQRGGDVHDVVVIGSGAGGGTAAKVLTDLGVKVTLIEAGPMITPYKDFKEHRWPYQEEHRGAGEGGIAYFEPSKIPFGFFSASFGGWTLDGEPYTVAKGSKFNWFRSRAMGGRTLHYGRISLRFADYDFKPYSTDGLGVDWPITYDEIAPYYDKAEDFIGVTGSKEGIRSAPDGIFQTPPPPRAHEVLIKKACDRLKIPCVASRLAIITSSHNGRAACHYCGQCGRGCVTASNYSSLQVQIMPALKSGRLTVIPHAMARELLTGPDGLVRAVSYVDKTTGQEREIRCRTVVVAASSCESARLLLNSKSGLFPDGLANSSGMVGRNLMDSTGFSLSATIPALRGMRRYDSDGMGGSHLYIPWWLWDRKKKDFPRGYHVELGGGFQMPGLGYVRGIADEHEGYGKSLKEGIYEDYGARVGLAGRGEMIPNGKTFCEIDPNVKDRWGIPVLRFNFQWTEHEINQVRHMAQTFQQILETMGGKVHATEHLRRADAGISIGGEIIHEIGTARMGADPKTSVLNKHSQAHDVKNLFIADGAPFVSNPDKNPTLTIVALSWRLSEYLAEEMRKGNV